MLELIDRSPVLQRMLWSVIRIGGWIAFLHALADLMAAFR